MTTVSMLLGDVTSGYPVKNSLRFRSSASAYLNRTPSVAGNRQKWTWSGWVKLGTLGVNEVLFGAEQNSTTGIGFGFQNTYAFQYSINGVGTFTTNAVFRDPSAWYHVVFAFDSTQATQANRSIVYINGVNYAFSSNGVVQNTNYDVNNTIAQYIGQTGVPSQYYDGYLAEVNFIDGQALTPSSFGTYDTNGVWQPINYSGSYGTNGFHLTFGNTTSTTTLGYDTSGNGNNWTPNNVSLTAGTTYDSMTDSPTVSSATVANYAVFNPVNVSGGGSTITDGNLSASAGSTGTYGKILGSIGMSSGKWYWEVTITAVGSLAQVGIGDGTPPNGSTGLGGAAGELCYFSNGNKYTNAVSTAYGATYTTNDVIGVAYDASAGNITFYKNNSSQGAITGFSGTKYAAVGSGGGTNPQYAINFGQRPFTYTPPTGFNALNTYNLPSPVIANGAQYMAATLYTATGSTPQTINNGTNNTIGTTFQPDLVWTKSRSAAFNNVLNDSVRGAQYYLYSNLTNAEVNDATYLTAFNSNGYSLGTGNFTNGTTMVGWQWKAGGTGVSNTNGSITSTVSANTTAGFSVVTYTGTGANATVGHGLGVALNFIILKSRNNADHWYAYHSSIGNTGAVFPDLTNATITNSGYWNNTSPTSSVFSIGTIPSQSTWTYVAYCWAAVAGYSAFGSYTGNGSSDGTFVYTGFRPRWIMVKQTTASSTTNWWIYDSSRDIYNVAGDELAANTSNAESSGNTDLDLLSNGFKFRSSTGGLNGSGGTYIYAAFAETPFSFSRAR